MEMLRDVDTTDPAFIQIANAALEMIGAGVEMDRNAIAIAIKVGRQRHADGIARAVPPPPRPDTGVVYYIRRGGLIKIGTTIHLRQRMRDLLPEAILAVEPGNQALEKKRHRKFAAFRVPSQREWFNPAPELLAHIDDVRTKHGDPDPTLPTLQNEQAS